MVAAATATNVAALRARQPASQALVKYGRAGRLLSGEGGLSDQQGCDRLVEILGQWSLDMGLPHLGEFGVKQLDIPAIVAASRNNSMKSNPVLLHDEEIAQLVRNRI